MTFLEAAPTRRAVEAQELHALGSTIGSVRSRNEDSGLIVSLRYGETPDHDINLAVVCDGMGGMSRGREASLTAISIFVSRIVRSRRNAPPLERLHRALEAAHTEVQSFLGGDGGTTLSAVLADRRGEFSCAHVGDSRIFVILEAGKLEQVSRDDTIAGLFPQPHHGRADAGRLIQFVGMDDELQPQLFHLPFSPSHQGVLITSDGAHSAPLDVISTVVKNARNSREVIHRLLTLSELLGGHDNATAALLRPFDQQVPPASSEGPSVDLFSIGGELQVWFTTPTEARDVSLTPRPEPSPERPANPPRPRRTKGGKRSRKPVKADSPEAAPLPAQLVVEFPDEHEGNG